MVATSGDAALARSLSEKWKSRQFGTKKNEQDKTEDANEKQVHVATMKRPTKKATPSPAAKEITKDATESVDTFGDATLAASLSKKWKSKQISPRKKMQNENALAAQDEASFISSENVDVDYIDEASATSSCQKRVMAPVDVKEESQKKRAKSAFDMKTYMRIRRQREKEMKEKQFVIDYLKKTSMLTMNTSGELP